MHIPESIWTFIGYDMALDYMYVDFTSILENIHLGGFLSGISVFAHAVNILIYVFKIPSFRIVLQKNTCGKCRRILPSSYHEIVETVRDVHVLASPESDELLQSSKV